MILKGSSGKARVVKDLVEGNGLYYSRIAAGGPWIFLASTAADHVGMLAADARVKPPYHLSPAAQVRYQTEYILNRYKEGLAELGSSFDDIVQVEQYIQLKAHADGYLEVSRAPGYLDHDRPSSALVPTGTFLPEGCVVNPMGIAVIPDPEKGFKKGPAFSGHPYPGLPLTFGSHYEKEAPVGEIITAGPYVFCTVTAADIKVGLRPDVKVADYVWWGNEIRNEARFAGEALAKKLAAVGTTLENVVHCTVHLNEIEDLYELDLVWKKLFPVAPPARTVTPVPGLFLPRREGAKTHAEGALKMELQFRSIRPGFGANKEIVSTGDEPLSWESEAVRAGSLLWITGQFAGGPDGLKTAPDTDSQIAYIFKRLDGICRAGGTTLGNLLRLRGYVTDVRDSRLIYAALKRAVPTEPPCVCITSIPGPFQIPGASVMIDAVAYVPE
jgi:enamine deaminase RidA (YjgF/YER057c/UK114 family)